MKFTTKKTQLFIYKHVVQQAKNAPSWDDTDLTFESSDEKNWTAVYVYLNKEFCKV